MKTTIITVLFLVLFANVNAQTLQEARKLTENEQYESATEMYKLLLIKDPSDAATNYYFGNNVLQSDNADSAKSIFVKALTGNPSSPLIKIGIAKILLDNINLNEAKSSSEKDGGNSELKSRYEEAFENVNEARKIIEEVTSNSKDIQLLIEASEALIKYKNKNTDKAKELLDRTLGIEPKNFEAHLLLGDLYTELNNGSLAADYYNRALDIDKSSARSVVSKGKLYKRSTNYEGAAREFENAIKMDPTYAPAYRELGEAFIKMGKLAQAKEEYRKYLELSKNNCGARTRYATFLYASKNYLEALSELSLVKQRCDSNNLLLLRVQVYSYYEANDTINSLASATRLFSLLQHEKRTSKDYEYYGKILIMNKQDSAGLSQLQKAFSLDQSRTDLLSEMANAWIKLKQFSVAIHLLQQKVLLGKDVKNIDHYTLGQAYLYNRQYTDADSVIAKLNELYPAWASAWLLRSRINANIDSTSEAGLAKAHYEKYIETVLVDSNSASKFSSGLAESYGYLAYYYILKSDTQNGLLYLKKKSELPLDAEERKKVDQAIDQLEGRGPKKK